MSSSIAPWQVWLANLNPQVGNEQAGSRPVIIVGSALMCHIAPRLALVVPCTKTDRGLPWQPRVELNVASSAMCEQVKSISRERLIRRLPHRVPQNVREEVLRILSTLITD